MTAPNCACGALSRLTTGKEVYPHRADLWAKSIYVCTADGCDGRVGCHPGTTSALGTPANAALRQERMKTHEVIDPLWRHAETAACYRGPLTRKQIAGIRSKARNRVYEFLADRLGIPAAETHVGMFDVDRCQRARSALRGITYPDIRHWHKQRQESEAA